MSPRSIIRLIISGDTKGAQRALRQTQTEAKKTGSSITNMAKVAALGFVAVAAAAVDFGRKAVKAAEDEQTAHVRLLTALKNTRQSWKDNKAVIAAVDKSSEQFGYTTADTENALAQAETAVGNTTKALTLLALAQNIAAETGKPLADVMLAVIKGSEGQIRPLRALGIDLPVAAGGAEKVKLALVALGKAQDHLKEVQKQQAEKGAGASAKASDKLNKAETNLGLLEERLRGKRFLTIAQQQELLRAQQAVNDANHTTVSNGPALENALKAVATAQSHLNDAQGAGDTIVGALSKKYAGAATASAKTFKGEIKALGAEFTDFEAKVGNKIIPVITRLMKALSSPDTFAAIGVAWHVIQQDITDVGNAIVDVMNAVRTGVNGFIRLYNAIPGHKDLGTLAKLAQFGGPKPLDFSTPGAGVIKGHHGALDPLSDSFIGPRTPAEALKYLQYKMQHPDKPFYGPVEAGGNMGPPAPMGPPIPPGFYDTHGQTVHITHIHAQGAQAPAKVRAALTRQQRRNGRTDYLKPYGVNPPSS